MTILSPFDHAESSVAHMPADMADRVRRLDEYSVRGSLGDKIGFARIEEFKGLENEAIIVIDLPSTASRSSTAAISRLENEAIIVIDLPAPGEVNGAASAHYVAMSRARSGLSLIAIVDPKA